MASTRLSVREARPIKHFFGMQGKTVGHLPKRAM
jgi:hypothetical protein